MRLSRWLATNALAVSLAGTLVGCGLQDEAKELGDKLSDKVSVCADALKLATYRPDANDPDKAKREASENADRLREIANKADEQDVKSALSALADQYAAVSEKQPREFANIGAWIDGVVRNQESLRKICL